MQHCNTETSASLMHLEMHHVKAQSPSSASSSRILDIPCKVCGDFSSGKHYNIFACDGCAGFFKRSIRRNRQYVCKAKDEGTCIIDKTHRNQCRACRLKKCQSVGMNKDAVQHERGPRNSTLRRQQMFFDGGRIPQPPPIFMTPPPPPPHALFPLINPAQICESAAQLLFMNVQFLRTLPAFTTLPLHDQLVLLEETWLDLFILGCSQFLPNLDLVLLLQNCTSCTPDFQRNVESFQETLKKIAQFQLDLNEFACLRAILLFKTNFNDKQVLNEFARVSLVQDDAQMRLNRHISQVYPKQPLRFGKVLLLISSNFKNITANTVEELFFKKVIRDTPIVAIISNMYKNQVVQDNNA